MRPRSWHRRQREMERGAMVRVRRSPEPTPVAVDDRATDREAHTQPTRLRRVERLEQPRRRGLAEADAGILHRDDRPEAILIYLTLLGFNLLGDGLRDIFDPKSRG